VIFNIDYGTGHENTAKVRETEEVLKTTENKYLATVHKW
jgi:hypothetical protein